MKNFFKKNFFLPVAASLYLAATAAAELPGIAEQPETGLPLVYARLTAGKHKKICAQYEGFMSAPDKARDFKVNILMEITPLGVNDFLVAYKKITFDGVEVKDVPNALSPLNFQQVPVFQDFRVNSNFRYVMVPAASGRLPKENLFTIRPGAETTFQGKPIKGSKITLHVRSSDGVLLGNTSFGPRLSVSAIDAVWFVTQDTPAFVISYEGTYNYVDNDKPGPLVTRRFALRQVKSWYE